MIGPRSWLLLPLLLLAACDGGSDDVSICPTNSNAPIADTLIGAKIDGRSVLVLPGSAQTQAGFAPWDSTYFHIAGWQTERGRTQILDLRIYGFHGVGSYPVMELSDSNYAWVAYGCQYAPYGLGGPPEMVSYFPLQYGLPGDSVRVTSWESGSGHLTGTFSFHVSGPEGSAIAITDGTFDVVVGK